MCTSSLQQVNHSEDHYSVQCRMRLTLGPSKGNSDTIGTHSPLLSSSWASMPWRCFSLEFLTKLSLRHVKWTRVVVRHRAMTTAVRQCLTSSTRKCQQQQQVRYDGNQTASRLAAAHASAGHGSCSSDLRTPVKQQSTVTDCQLA